MALLLIYSDFVVLFSKLTFEGQLAGKDLTTGIGVRVAYLKSESSGFRTTDNMNSRRCRWTTTPPRSCPA